jgi:DHA1 family bicyclomycin/chloramphenicol resistance-like MFS transporter
MQGYTSAISGVVPMLAPLLGAALLPLGWRAIYAALVAGGAVLLSATLVWLPESLVEPGHHGGAGGIRTAYGRFLLLPRSIALCALVAFSFAGLFAFISGSPFVLVRELGLSGTQYGIAFAISSGAILSGAWIAGSLAHRIGSERLLRLASIGAALAGGAAFVVNLSAGSAHAPSAAAFVTAMAAYAFTFGLIVPGAFAAGMEHAGAMAGVAAGTLGATQMLGGAIGSTINGLLPFEPHIDVGISVGIAGLGTLVTYLWSTRGIDDGLAGIERVGAERGA